MHVVGRAPGLQQNGAASQTFVNNTYSALMSERLKGKRIAVLFVGYACTGPLLAWRTRKSVVNEEGV